MSEENENDERIVSCRLRNTHAYPRGIYDGIRNEVVIRVEPGETSEVVRIAGFVYDRLKAAKTEDLVIVGEAIEEKKATRRKSDSGSDAPSRIGAG